MQQKTLSLLQFQRKFGTEKACQRQLFRLRWPEGFKAGEVSAPSIMGGHNRAKCWHRLRPGISGDAQRQKHQEYKVGSLRQGIVFSIQQAWLRFSSRGPQQAYLNCCALLHYFSSTKTFQPFSNSPGKSSWQRNLKKDVPAFSIVRLNNFKCQLSCQELFQS
jgi:hypothetical protein